MNGWKNLFERALWTLLQAGFGLEAVTMLHLPVWIMVPVAAVLSVLKTTLQAHLPKRSRRAVAASTPETGG